MKQELQHSGRGELPELRIFEKARDSDLIKTAPASSIEGVLRQIMVKVGLRAANLPDEVETAVLLEHILTEYGNHTTSEIKLAFDMAVSGKLDLLQSEVNCYENFSCLYFSTIMGAYRKWAAIQAKQIPVKTPEQVLYDAEQLRNIQREDIENFYQRLLLGREVLENAADWFKEVLVFDGLMTERDHLPQFFFTRAYGGSKNIYVKN